jgi:hypothetical protein
MKKIYLFILTLLVFGSANNSNAQFITWTDTFTVGIAPTPAQIATWNNFRAQLLGSYTYTKMTISGTYDPVGQSTSDPAIILAYANALRTLTSYTSPLTNGNVWSLCGTRYLGEVWLNPPAECSTANCPFGYIIRPGGPGAQYGGVNSATCSPPSQTMVFTFEYCPTVAIAAFNPDSVCVTAPTFALPVGTPGGGTYSGNGVSGTTFTPSIAGIGSHYVTYTYTDSNTCSSSDSTLIVVESCVGIDEAKGLSGVNIYPNPTNNVINVSLDNITTAVNFTLTSIDGKVIYQANNVNDTKTAIDISNNAKGVYFLKVEANNQQNIYKVIKQ